MSHAQGLKMLLLDALRGTLTAAPTSLALSPKGVIGISNGEEELERDSVVSVPAPPTDSPQPQ